jgi:glycosyltransferase involved in cell wall biosynthesis
MRIGIDIRPMTAAGMGRGLAIYATNLIKHLLLVDQTDDFFLFAARDQGLPDFLRSPALKDNVTIIRLKRPTRNIFLWDQLFWYPLLKTHRIEVFHSLVYGVPLLCPCPKILTIHDLTPLIFPDFIKIFRHKIVFRFNFFTGKYADRIITSSSHSQHDLMRYLQIPERNILVIFDGVTQHYRVIEDSQEIEQTKTRYHIPGKFVLYVGGFDQNKNLTTLVKAFHLLIQSRLLEEPFFLVFVGKLNSTTDGVRETVNNLGLENRVVFTDFVSEDDQIKLYNAAEVFIFPSLYEGFGLPPLEAMACGTPVIASHAASLPEVVGDAAIQVDPHSPEEFCQAMHDVLTNYELRKNLRRKGLERVKQFPWEETARQTLQVYQEFLSQKLRS